MYKLFKKLKLYKYLPKFPIAYGVLSLLFYSSGTIILISLTSLFGFPIAKILDANFNSISWKKVEGKIHHYEISKQYQRTDENLFDSNSQRKSSFRYFPNVIYEYNWNNKTYKNTTIYPQIDNFRSGNKNNVEKIIEEIKSNIDGIKINVYINKNNPKKSYILKVATWVIIVIIIIGLIVLVLNLYIIFALFKEIKSFIITVKEVMKTKLEIDYFNQNKKRLKGNLVGLVMLLIFLLILNSDAGGVKKFMYYETLKRITPYGTVTGDIASVQSHPAPNFKIDSIKKITIRYEYRVAGKKYVNSRIFDNNGENNPSIFKNQLDTLRVKSNDINKELEKKLLSLKSNEFKVTYDRWNPSHSFLFKQISKNKIMAGFDKLFSLTSFLFFFMLFIIIAAIPGIMTIQQFYRVIRDIILVQKTRN